MDYVYITLEAQDTLVGGDEARGDWSNVEFPGRTSHTWYPVSYGLGKLAGKYMPRFEFRRKVSIDVVESTIESEDKVTA